MGCAMVIDRSAVHDRGAIRLGRQAGCSSSRFSGLSGGSSYWLLHRDILYYCVYHKVAWLWVRTGSYAKLRRSEQ